MADPRINYRLDADVSDFREAVRTFVRDGMNSTGEMVAQCVRMATGARTEERFAEACRLAGSYAEEGVRAAKLLGLYGDDEA